MLENRDELYVVTELLENTGYWLLDERTEAREHTRKLKLLQRKISELAKNSSNANLVLLDNFLSNYIDRLWSNLAVDFTYEGGRLGSKILNKFLRYVGEGLLELSEAFKEGSRDRFLGALLSLSLVYRNSLRELKRNRKTISRERFKIGKIVHPEAMSRSNRELCPIVAEGPAITQSEYTLAAGSPSKYFFDIDKLLSKPQYIRVLAKFYARVISKVIKKDRIDRLAFIEKDVGTIGALPLMSVIVIRTRIEAFIVRLWKEIPFGKIKCSLGSEPKRGESIGIVSDVATTSGAILETSKEIRKYKARARYAFVLYDREQGAKEKLAKYGITLVPILTRSELQRIGLVPSYKERPFEDFIPFPKQKAERYNKEIRKETLETERKIFVG